MISPDDDATILEFSCCRLTNGFGPADHPRYDPDTIREDNQALGNHTPESLGEGLVCLIQNEAEG